jgi:hypothetical protein
MMVDTQIISYAFKGRSGLRDVRISSVVAHEFLETYDPASRTNAKYYIRYDPKRAPGFRHEIPSDHKPALGERIVYDFGNEYPSLVEHGSHTMAALLNDRNEQAFADIIWSLDKAVQKRLRRRFAFLCGTIDDCTPLGRETAELGLSLLAKFTEKHNIKGNVRNSVNDIMILAAAVAGGEQLLTADHVLNRFAAEVCGATLSPHGGDFLDISFGPVSKIASRANLESKGYVNRGWQVAERARRSAIRM